jgi:hypothetical protein
MGMNSVLQSWVEKSGLRHQGVLVSAIRGCDNISKEDASKPLIRAYRGFILQSFDKKPSSFIEYVDKDELICRMNALVKNFDHYSIHFILHLLQAAEIIGYKHPDVWVKTAWLWFYNRMCKKMHVNSETDEQLDNRFNANETIFAARAT